MTKRDVVRQALRFEPVPYVPWSFGFTHEAAETLRAHYGQRDLSPVLDNHFLGFGSGIGFFTPLPDSRFRDFFGVVWDRSVDRDIGIVEGTVLPEPSLRNYTFPDPVSPLFFDAMASGIAADRNDPHFRVFNVGFSLYERAWTLRGMENLMLDFYEHPRFAHELLEGITDYTLRHIAKAMTYEIDAVHFGDDWGMQTGLQMGEQLWRTFIKPCVARLYDAVRRAGLCVSIHSCGKVDSLFDDLVELGLNLFNPFQPEVMDVEGLMRRYRGRLAFHGGLSTQKTLPYGTPADVRAATRRLLELGRCGGYVFSPAHAVEGDVPLENMLAFIDCVKSQSGYTRA